MWLFTDWLRETLQDIADGYPAVGDPLEAYAREVRAWDTISRTPFTRDKHTAYEAFRSYEIQLAWGYIYEKIGWCSKIR